MARASVHVKRHLKPRELATIAVALEMLARADAGCSLDDARADLAVTDALLGDNEMRALAYELTRARKVKVCRTKHKEH
jgi:hypothetical protein